MMSNSLPETIPACALNLLAREEWFADPQVTERVKLAEPNWLARIITSPPFNRGDVSAVTLGHTIYYRKQERFDPHSTAGLALLAHEAKHVEQYEREGLIKFCAKYVLAFLSKGYGRSIPFEGEAYELQEKVKTHLESEFADNHGHASCQEMGPPHTPNGAYVKATPEREVFAV
jgi:hypothetical protein